MEVLWYCVSFIADRRNIVVIQGVPPNVALVYCAVGPFSIETNAQEFAQEWMEQKKLPLMQTSDGKRVFMFSDVIPMSNNTPVGELDDKDEQPEIYKKKACKITLNDCKDIIEQDDGASVPKKKTTVRRKKTV